MMAAAEIRPDWTIGTLNLTSGSVNFTTTGSMLQTAAIQPGDEIITRSGLVLIIASITGQNSGTLMEPCPAGAAGSGQPLRIRFQPDGSRYNGATADLVQLLSSGNVHSLSGIVGANNTMPYFTGPGTMGRTELTAFARSLLDDANAEAMRSTLELTGNSIADMIQDSPGAYSTTAVNLNTLAPGARGLYAYVAGSSNFPVDSGLWYIETQRMFTGVNARLRQVATGYTAAAAGEPVVYMRVRIDATTWGPWRCLTHINGSNSNGSYIRFADGTQICWAEINLTSTNMSSASGAFFVPSDYITWTFPAAFSGNPVVTGVFRRPSTIVNGVSLYSLSSVLANYVPWNGSALGTGVAKFVQLEAVGRWF